MVFNICGIPKMGSFITGPSDQTACSSGVVVMYSVFSPWRLPRFNTCVFLGERNNVIGLTFYQLLPLFPELSRYSLEVY